MVIGQSIGPEPAVARAEQALGDDGAGGGIEPAGRDRLIAAFYYHAAGAASGDLMGIFP